MKPKKIGILLIATGRYINFFETIYNSIEKFFFKDIEKHYFLFTDSSKPLPKNVERIQIECLGYPGDTLYRYHRFLTIEDIIKECSIPLLYYFDVDMKIIADIGEEFLPDQSSPLIGAIHPGYRLKKSGGAPERNPKSTACIHTNEKYPYYICGGVQGGFTEHYLSASSSIKKMIDIDTKNNIVALWYDESHWNRYMASNTHKFKFMDSGYCYPEIAYLRNNINNKTVMSKSVVTLFNFYSPFSHLKDKIPKILARDKDRTYYQGIKITTKEKIKLMVKKFFF